MLHRILILIYKELWTLLNDKKTRFVVLIPPVLQLFIFAFAATLDVTNVHMAILNQDNGEKGFELAQRFHGSPTFSKITYLKGVEEIAPYIDNQWGVMVISIDEQFSRDLHAGKPADIEAIFDGRKSNSTQVVAGYVLSIVEQFNLDNADRSGVKLQNSTLVPRNWFNENLIYYWMNVPNLTGLLTMLIALLLTVLSIARERELGTFDQLLVSPILPLEIIIGKTIPPIIIGMVEGILIVLVSTYILGVPFKGNVLYLFFSLFFFISSAVGVGLFISALCNTQQQAILGGQFFITPAILLSGYATPVENMPVWLQYINYINPVAYYLVVAQGVFLKDMSFALVWAQTWPIAIIAVCTLTGAALLCKGRLN